MKRIISQTILASCILLIASIGISAGSSNQATFTLSKVKFKCTLPNGFSVVSGKSRKIADIIANADTTNKTLFTAIPSEDVDKDTVFTKFIVVKTPIASIGAQTPSRQEFVKEMKAEIKRPETTKMLADPVQIAGKTYQEVFGDDAKIGGDLYIVDADQYAGYMCGTISVDLSDGKQVTACTAALTIIRGNMIFYYKFSPYNSPSDFVDLLNQTKVEIKSFLKENAVIPKSTKQTIK